VVVITIAENLCIRSEADAHVVMNYICNTFAGSRMMRDLLNRQGHHIGRRHTRTLMKKMGINALYRKPNLSQANQAHRKYPYLLKVEYSTE
jgi:hypothetical protein